MKRGSKKHKKHGSKRGSKKRGSKRKSQRKKEQNAAETIRKLIHKQIAGAGGGLGDMFRLIDSDDSKGISFKEFKTFVKKTGKCKGFSNDEFRQAFDHIDDDGNGTIELSEFKMWMGPI